MQAIRLDSLSKLLIIAQEQRAKAEAKENPEEILINRKIRIDHYGQISLLEESSDDTERWSFGAIPNATDKCRLCQKPWKVNNLRTFVSEEGRESVVHSHCKIIEMAHKERLSFINAFDSAGFGPYQITEIENGYTSRLDTPWYKVKTLKGEFTIGWRKRVMCLTLLQQPYCPERMEWPGPNFEELFASEGIITRGSNFIHAWSHEKLVDYLKVLNSTLDFV